MKEKKKLEQTGKSFGDFDNAKNKELTGYLTLLEDQIFWESRKEYCQIFDFFLSKKISLAELFKQFYGLRGSNIKAFNMHEENLEAEASGILTESNEKNFQLKPESHGFTKIISSLHSWVNLCEPEITFEMNVKHPELIGYGISEEFLRLIIKNDLLPQIYKYCKES